MCLSRQVALRCHCYKLIFVKDLVADLQNNRFVCFNRLDCKEQIIRADVTTGQLEHLLMAHVFFTFPRDDLD